MNNPVHISESLETIFWVKYLKIFNADPGSGIPDHRMVKSQIRDKHPGSVTLLKRYCGNLVSSRLLTYVYCLCIAGTGTSKEKGEKKRFRLSSSFTSRENVQVSSLGDFFLYDNQNIVPDTTRDPYVIC